MPCSPAWAISLDDLSVIGTGQFANDTLIAASNIDVAANLISVIKGDDIKVSGIFLESPRIHALVAKDGSVNWDITKPTLDTAAASDTSASAFKLTLNKYEIKDGYILYDDQLKLSN
ncbi:MAG: hypothetical protein EOO89_24285 [Pedobacter sp.]|nr:MAG: hypothetical protein EOO89_24285 [Pedobacter sp.]